MAKPMPNQNKIHTLNNLGNGLLFFLIELMIIFLIYVYLNLGVRFLHWV